MKIIIDLFKFIFWAPRVAQEMTTSADIRPRVVFSKILISSLGIVTGGLSLVVIWLGNEEWVQLGAYGLIMYTIIGLIMVIFYNHFDREYLP